MNYELFRTFAPMFTGCILLLALITAPDDIDSIRTERIDEVIVTSNSARQRLQSVQAGAERSN